MLSKRLNTIVSVLVQHMCGVRVASQQGASPLLSAALIYLDAYDVILPRGLPCQA